MDEEEIIGRLIDLIQAAIESGAEADESFLNEIAGVMSEILSDIGGQPEPLQAPLEAPIPEGADLLWILSGGDQSAFVNYLRTFPDPGLNALLQNPQHLTATIAHLAQSMPQGGAPPSKDGIQKAPLNSSNIYGFRYDPKTGKLMVRFQSGSVYGYDGVPHGVFRVFQHGAVPAKTDGKNRFGEWWKGKIPSLGAAFYNLIRQGGYPYQKLR